MLGFIAERILTGAAPTVREIGARIGIASTNAVLDHVSRLERRGLVERSNYKQRDVRMTEAGWTVLALRKCSHCDGKGRVG